MEWRVIKMGTETFDILHTYGVGIVLACATNEPVVVQDEGCSYRLSSPCITVPQASVDVLDEVFQLPQAEEVLRVQQAQSFDPTVPLRVANLDGLLATLITNPEGVRIGSLLALLDKHRFDPSIIERGITS